MENMLPGNSFPQICVVSVNKYVENKGEMQGHTRIVALSNHRGYSFDTWIGVRSLLR